MSATTGGTRRIPLSPPEGWLSLGLVLLICLSLAWALDDALLLGQDHLTDMLPWAAIGGVLAGFVGPLLGWGRWRTYALGAVVAALLMPVIVGLTIRPDGDDPIGLFRATADSAFLAWRDLFVLDRMLTPEFGHHLLILALLLWGSSMFASFATFGHRRPLNGVLLIGLLLIANMALTARDQLVYLVVFAAASLFLLIRAHTFEEQAEWIRRRIGDPATLSGLYLRGGTIFIVVAVLGSLVLTNIAASAPLAAVWTDVGGRVIDWSRDFSRYFPQPGSGIALGPSFGSSSSIGGRWTTNQDIAFTAEVPLSALGFSPYWRVATYDTLELDGYSQSEDRVDVEVAAGDDVLEGSPDRVDAAGRQAFTVRITPASGSYIYAPQSPSQVDIPTRVTLQGAEGYFAGLASAVGTRPYSVTSLVPVLGDTLPGGLTENKLRVAGTDYPEAIIERYAAAPGPEIMGPESRAILDEILAAGADNPYDIAVAIETYLKDPDNFTYDTDIIDDGIECGSLSKVECFAVSRRGWCQQYATMMTAFLREAGVPARVAGGFLPGDRVPSTGIETVRNDRAHAWVEVYFPGYGWVDRDPVGGSVSQLEPLPPGVEVDPNALPTPIASIPTITRPPESDEPVDGGSGAGAIGGTGAGPLGPLVAMALLLAIVVGSLAFVAWRRGPRGPVSADGAYGMVTALASRFGFAPRPEQTVYEYAGALAEVLPGARPELETVARAKVEVAYGGRRIVGSQLFALRQAQRRLRTSLLRLAFKRGRRR